MLIKQKIHLLKLYLSKLLIPILFYGGNIFCQSFTPVTVTGFNHDVIAESGTGSLTTTIPLNGVTVSNKIMYSVTFRNTNGFGGGGFADNGIITDASGTYQLAPYTRPNALSLQRTQTGDLTQSTPTKFNSVGVLCFSTEGTSAINVLLTFTV